MPSGRQCHRAFNLTHPPLTIPSTILRGSPPIPPSFSPKQEWSRGCSAGVSTKTWTTGCDGVVRRREQLERTSGLTFHSRCINDYMHCAGIDLSLKYGQAQPRDGSALTHGQDVGTVDAAFGHSRSLALHTHPPRPTPSEVNNAHSHPSKANDVPRDFKATRRWESIGGEGMGRSHVHRRPPMFV